MNWSLHRWVWLLEAPLFIGMAPAGTLNRCRLYVPARAVWGAMTAELARAEAGDSEPDYKRVGDDLWRNARFTYLFPAVQVDGSWYAWLPKYEPRKGLVWIREDRPPAAETNTSNDDRLFRYRLIGSRPGTAIDPDTDSAADGSLRETECISSQWRSPISGKPAGPVALVGYVFLRDMNRSWNIYDISTLFLGGDTRYGLGRVKRAEIGPADVVFGAQAVCNVDAPRVISSRLLAHGMTNRELQLQGAREILGGWDRMKLITKDCSVSYWIPGSLNQNSDESQVEWIIDKNGIWRDPPVA